MEFAASRVYPSSVLKSDLLSAGTNHLHSKEILIGMIFLQERSRTIPQQPFWTAIRWRHGFIKKAACAAGGTGTITGLEEAVKVSVGCVLFF